MNIRHNLMSVRAAALVLALSSLLGMPMLKTAAGQNAAPDLVSTAVTRLDAVASDTMARTGVPGIAIAVVYRDQVVYLKGFGVRAAGTAGQVDADTVFQLASVSKPVASTVVAALVGDGALSWDDPIISHDPEFAMADPWVTQQITVRDMFAHRSGLPDHNGDVLEDIGYDRAEVLHRLRYQQPDSSFRSAYAYTNFGITEGAVAAARAAGGTWEDVSSQRLYQPLEMTSTSSRYSDFVAAPNRVRTHVRVDGQWVAKYDRDPDAQSPAGGVSSTVRDMAQWMRLQLNDGAIDGRQIISPEALRETHRPQIVSRPPGDPSVDRASFYGLGWNVSYDDEGRVRLGHSGGFAYGAATNVTLVPSERLGIIVLTNAMPTGASEAVAASFVDLALTGSVQRDWLTFLGPLLAATVAPPYGAGMDYSHPPASASAARPSDAYLGTYANDYYGPVEISRDGEGLVLHMGPRQTAFALTHWDGDVFLYQPVGENSAGLSRVTFAIGPDQRAMSVEIEFLNIYGGDGTLPRAED